MSRVVAFRVLLPGVIFLFDSRTTAAHGDSFVYAVPTFGANYLALYTY